MELPVIRNMRVIKDSVSKMMKWGVFQIMRSKKYEGHQAFRERLVKE